MKSRFHLSVVALTTLLTLEANRPPGEWLRVCIREAVEPENVPSSWRLVRHEPEIYEFYTDSPEEAAHALSARGDLAWIGRDHSFSTQTFSLNLDEPIAGSAWHLDALGLPEARSEGAAPVTIAIVDTGVDTRHQEFHGRVVHPWDALDRDHDPMPDPYDDHGTASAGLALAARDGRGIIGVCPDCLLMPIRIMGQSGRLRSRAAADAIYWAVDHGADVISCSWAPPRGAPATELRAALRYATTSAPKANRRVILFAAGNDGRVLDPDDVTSMPEVWTVGAADRLGLLDSRSNHGPAVRFIAPAATVSASNFNTYTRRFGGTSAATAVAAGAVGTLMHPALDRHDILRLLGEYAEPVKGAHRDQVGLGRLRLTPGPKSGAQPPSVTAPD